jgi:hypothetical protein
MDTSLNLNFIKPLKNFRPFLLFSLLNQKDFVKSLPKAKITPLFKKSDNEFVALI